MRPASVYKSVQVETASPERVLVTLLQAAAAQMRTAREALARGDRARGMAAVERAANIAIELEATLKEDAAPELCQTLKELYRFTVSRLTLAGVTGDARHVDEAQKAFCPVAEAFIEAASQGAAGAR